MKVGFVQSSTGGVGGGVGDPAPVRCLTSLLKDSGGSNSSTWSTNPQLAISSEEGLLRIEVTFAPARNPLSSNARS
jgi:hypothetical protein